MSKRIAWLAAAGLSVMAAAMGLWSYTEANKPMFLRGENEAQEQGRPPVDGDYWAIRVGYGGDPHNLRFEPRWLLHSKEQDARIASGVPAGMKDYRKPAGSPLDGSILRRMMILLGVSLKYAVDPSGEKQVEFGTRMSPKSLVSFPSRYW